MATTSGSGALCRFGSLPRWVTTTMILVPVGAAIGAFGATGASAAGPEPVRLVAAHSAPSPGPSAAPPTVSTAASTASKAARQKGARALAAFFAAGYDYDDAVAIAAIWRRADVASVKVDAGRKLLRGVELPIEAGQGGAPGHGLSEKQIARFVTAFYDAGYDYDDAVALAKLWRRADVASVKVDAGRKLLRGVELPIEATGSDESERLQALTKFADVGYDYDDAVALARVWKRADVFEVKVDAGLLLLSGIDLPFGPEEN